MVENNCLSYWDLKALATRKINAFQFSSWLKSSSSFFRSRLIQLKSLKTLLFAHYCPRNRGTVKSSVQVRSLKMFYGSVCQVIMTPRLFSCFQLSSSLSPTVITLSASRYILSLPGFVSESTRLARGPDWPVSTSGPNTTDTKTWSLTSDRQKGKQPRIVAARGSGRLAAWKRNFPVAPGQESWLQRTSFKRQE